MKEKFKKIIKKKIIVILLCSILGIYIIFDKSNIYIDIYNFGQLTEVISTLNKLNGDYTFFGTKEFNEKFNKDIRPLKNCYFLTNKNRFLDGGNGGGYIMAFQVKSYILGLFYSQGYYVYPRYDLPRNVICTGKCKDGNYELFLETISNPCKD